MIRGPDEPLFGLSAPGSAGSSAMDAVGLTGAGTSTAPGSSKVDEADVGVVDDDADGGGDDGALLGLGELVVLAGVLVPPNSGSVGFSPASRPVTSRTVATTRAAAASPMSTKSQRGSRDQVG